MAFRNRRQGTRSTPRQFDDQTPIDRKAAPPSNTNPSIDRLCSRVAEIIETRLTACHEPDLEECRVAGVQPISGVRVLMVTLAPLSDDRPFNAETAATAATRATSFLRAEVTSALNRKQAPHLRFVIVPAQWQGAT
jgi:ribosome-binding factor A